MLLEDLGPTNRIAQQLVNRLELAEDREVEAKVIYGELWEMFGELNDLAQWGRLEGNRP